MRRTVPLAITFIVGVVLIVSKFIPHKPFGSLGEEFSIYFDIIAVFAFILGGGNLMRLHGDKIYRQKPGWGFSVVCIAGFLFTLVVGLLKLGVVDGKTVMGFPGDWKGDVTAEATWFYAIYEYSFKPLAATMFALLAFYVASASYRAFRAKNFEATVLLLAAFVILLGRTFIGKWVSFWVPIDQPGYDIPALAEWIMDFPNRAGQRAIMIGIALGIVSTSLKLILGIERAYLGVEEE